MGGGVPPLENLQLSVLIINISVGIATMYKYRLFTMLLIVLLGLNSGVLGIAIGVADTEADPWKCLWNISLINLALAMAMGNALYKLLPDRPFLATIAYLFAFIVSTPIGVAIGIRIDDATLRDVFDVILVVTTGSVVGVWLFDAVYQGIYRDSRPLKPCYLGAFVSGILCMGVLTVALVCDRYKLGY